MNASIAPRISLTFKTLVCLCQVLVSSHLRTCADPLTPTATAAPQLVQPAGGDHNLEATTGPTLAENLDKIIHGSRQPVPWWRWSADLRIRDEYFNNIMTLDSTAPWHEQNYLRYRARWWNVITPVTNFDLNFRLAWEGRYFTEPRAKDNFTGMDWNVGLIDNLNIRWKNLAGLPLTLTVGRQDILNIGDGWLLVDGTPLDGSGTLYFDAARLTLECTNIQTTIDAVYIDQGARNDRWLPPINRLEKYMMEDDERAVVLYGSKKIAKALQTDAFAIYKHTDAVMATGMSGDLYTLGGLVSGAPGDHWKYKMEGAWQTGHRRDAMFADRDVEAFGLNSRVTWLPGGSLQPQVRMSYEFLSGDNPNTPGDEMFDLLWGRWPSWSELYIYSYQKETRVLQVNNLCRVGPGWTITLAKKLDLISDYYLLFSDQDSPTRGTPALFTQTGNMRGQMITGVLKYRHNEHISMHLWSEFIFPGDYYTHSDLLTFLRADILFTW